MSTRSNPLRSQPPLKGRPREFDSSDVLDAAVRVFRKRGYHAASMQDLQDATNLTSGSLYKAFLDKRSLFVASFQRYVSERMRRRSLALRGCLSGRDRLHRLMRGYARSSSGEEGRLGCMVAGSAMTLAIFDDEIAALIKATLLRTERCLEDLILQGCADGSIASSVDAAVLARYLLCLLQGMRVVGKTGRMRREMDDLVALALQAIPST